MGQHSRLRAVSAFVFLPSKTRSAIEYPDPNAAQDPHDLQDTSYIECKSDEIFSIQFTVKPSKLGVLRGKNLAFFAEIDGKRISYGAVCGPKGFHSEGNHYDYKMEGEFTSTVSDSALNRFKFAEVQKVQHAPHAIQDREAISKLGEIIVYVHHIEYDDTLALIPVPTLGGAPNQIEADALEAANLSHTTGFEKPKATEFPRVRQSRFVEEVLQQMGIVRSPLFGRPLVLESPAPLPVFNPTRHGSFGTGVTEGRSNNTTVMIDNAGRKRLWRLDKQKYSNLLSAENANGEENVSMMEKSHMVGAEVHGKENTSLKRKAGYDNSVGEEDDCVFLFERPKKRNQ